MKPQRSFFETLRAACALTGLPRNLDFAFVPELTASGDRAHTASVPAPMSFETLGQRLRGDLPI